MIRCEDKCTIDLNHHYCIKCNRSVEEIKEDNEKKKQEKLLKKAWKNLPV